MPSCCQCNCAGRCSNCSCKKGGKSCVDCLPSRRGRCDNLKSPSVVQKDANPAEQSNADPVQSEVVVNEAGNVRISHDPSGSLNLPPFAAMSDPKFKWREIDGRSFHEAIGKAYDEVVQWKRNVFSLPSGQYSKAFIKECTRLLLEYAEGSSLECVAIKALMVMPSLLLQKPFQKSKAKDHKQCLERRLALWTAGDIQSLLQEGHSIQAEMTLDRSKEQADNARAFARLMFAGKVKAALLMISNEEKGGLLIPDQPVGNGGENELDILKRKHPPQQSLVQSALTTTSNSTLNPVIFEELNGILI